MSSSRKRSQAYTAAGVDIDAGNRLVDRIKAIVATTQTRGVMSGIGGFGGLYKPDIENMDEPVLVAATDGVGTKLKLAFAFDRHDTVGIDLVAMSVNDIIVQGAKPLFFLDYFATGKLDVDKAEQVVAGIGEGCRQAKCVLLGGETAEMPSMYADGEYDLAGFCVGMVDNSRIVDGSSIKVGDSIIGIASSGPHSNGYSLIRKLLDQSDLGPDDMLPGSDQTVATALLAPTIIYADCIRNLLRDFEINGMVHITGGGFYDNIPRVLPAQVGARIEFGSWTIAPVFHWLREQGGLEWPEMLQIFNCGIGYMLIVPEEQTEDVLRRITALQLEAWQIGTIWHCPEKEGERVEIVFPE
ncbi:phosphoribosylformylglycinamidine cyclo-ligase [Desulfovibrio sp. OttesenSCG-928-M14]|nr:phosphoribosylformylglycinamidine cyclo-ligase [Desulfovibrio sp. OttesenSCG-928-M14]